jgi:hypothetical protein
MNVRFGWKAVIAKLAGGNHCGPMQSRTAKLPKGHSYPLKPSALEAALASAGVIIDVHLVRSPGDLFSAHFWPPNENVPYDRLYVQAGSVSREIAAEARHHAEAVMIPRLVQWVTSILAQDGNSPVRREQQVLDLPRA